MRRREFITIIGGAAVAWPLAARAQQPAKLPTIGFLGATTPVTWSLFVAAFVQRLRELGWIEGRTIAIEYRWAEGRGERFAEIAAEFVRLHLTGIPRRRPIASACKGLSCRRGPRPRLRAHASMPGWCRAVDAKRFPRWRSAKSAATAAAHATSRMTAGARHAGNRQWGPNAERHVGDVLGGGSTFGLSGGEAETTVAGGGSLAISAGGTEGGTQLAGTEVMGGLDIPATISSGATVASGGTAGSAIAPSDGTLIVNAGGVAANAAVIAGGPEIVSADSEQDGTANAPVIGAGSQILAAGSAASGTVVSGGVLNVASGGLADPASISSGGDETVIAAGIGAQTFGGTRDVLGFASGAVAFAGSQSIETGSQAIESGGTASGPTIESGGLVLASSGGIASNTGINSGDLESGGGNWTSR